MQESFSSRTLTDLVVRHLPGARGTIVFRRIPTGKFNTSFFVSAEGAEYVLRIAPPRDSVFLFYERDMMKQEPELHALLREKTTIPVAKIIAFDDSHEMIDRDYLIMERLPGCPLTDAIGADATAVFRQVGAFPSQAHAITARQYGYLGAHHPMTPRDAWAEAFADMWGKLIADIEATGHYAREEGAALVDLLDQHLSLFDRPVQASLLHMDVWHQNILVNGGCVTGLIDWDRALWGDPEIEFAVLDYCGISKPAFWEGYGRVRDDSRPARIRGLFYYLYESQKYIVIRHGRQNDAAGARQYKAETMKLVGQAFGAL